MKNSRILTSVMYNFNNKSIVIAKIIFDKRYIIILILLLLASSISFAQNDTIEKWSKNEIAQYKTLKNLAKYVTTTKSVDISNDTLFIEYIYFDYVLKDPDKERKIRRIQAFSDLFPKFKNIVDSIGIQNLDAKPVRFYKDNKIYEPFKMENAKETIGDKKMYTKDENVFAYYKKNQPDEPRGTLLFEPSTNKLLAWVLIDQGGYHYFLIFNLF